MVKFVVSPFRVNPNSGFLIQGQEFSWDRYSKDSKFGKYYLFTNLLSEFNSCLIGNYLVQFVMLQQTVAIINFLTIMTSFF